LLAFPEANIIARFIFGKESKMVKCMLTPNEALQVYDVSPRVYGRWSPASKPGEVHALSSSQGPGSGKHVVDSSNGSKGTGGGEEGECTSGGPPAGETTLC